MVDVVAPIVLVVAIYTLSWLFAPGYIWWMEATSTERWRRWSRWSKVPEGYAAVRRRRSELLVRTSGMSKPVSAVVILIPRAA